VTIEQAVLQLLVKQPFYGSLASAVSWAEDAKVLHLAVRCASPPVLAYHRAWFEALPPARAVGAVLHELLHLILLHPLRRAERTPHLWALACDMAVNEHIPRSQLPPDAVTVEKIAREITYAVPRNRSAETYYLILASTTAFVSFTESEDQVSVFLEGGEELRADKTPDQPPAEGGGAPSLDLLSEWARQAGGENEIPPELAPLMTELYQPARVNWRNVLKRFLTNRGTIQVSKTYKRESRRYDTFPGTKRTKGFTALLAFDESGSISDRQRAEFLAELTAIKKITGTEVLVTPFDTACSQPQPLRAFDPRQRRVRRGGTDFRPVFALADQKRIPLLIVFTDGDGPAPEATNQKVLWVLTPGGKAPVGYGHTVHFQD